MPTLPDKEHGSGFVVDLEAAFEARIAEFWHCWPGAAPDTVVTCFVKQPRHVAVRRDLPANLRRYLPWLMQPQAR
ncbi:hypothetical protein [Serinibacter arcticus]|uniref:hypothetical protein n=1 Tax=Serinibacter arcticus TaxID=1655435 RepID=UPI0011B2760D|nr:hypothetical protein [Serinibacter arcticus]